MIVGAEPVSPSPSLLAGELVSWAEARLRGVSDTARLEAELLLADCAGLNRAAVMAHPERALDPEQAVRLTAMVARRGLGEPLAYLLGSREFYSLTLAVTADVLIPRPETELLVEAALELEPPTGAQVLDLGTGSGAIALALKHERPDFEVTAVDRSQAALAVARRNAERLGLDVRWLESDWFFALGRERFDLIVANPPYVASRDRHFDQGLAYEPRMALDGGDDGLDACRAILGAAALHLERDGRILLEHGFDQRPALLELAAAHALFLVTVHDDFAGLPRVAVFAPAAHG